jgi:hypothetical protein
LQRALRAALYPHISTISLSSSTFGSPPEDFIA